MRLELMQPIFGASAGHLDLRSGSSLSWSEHYALKASAAGLRFNFGELRKEVTLRQEPKEQQDNLRHKNTKENPQKSGKDLAGEGLFFLQLLHSQHCQ
jgi:hypothetical protein